jgi:acetylglutamate kinase
VSILIKISGHELDSQEYLASLTRALAEIDEPIVIVHGGGKEISAMQERMGIVPIMVDGVRVTDAESLALVEMVLCGAVNKRLVRTLVSGGINALGLSGVDAGIIRADRLSHASVDMGFTGDVRAVRAEPLHALMRAGFVPVIAPICMGESSSMNVNADVVAGAVAAAIAAEQVYFLSNVPGVLRQGEVLPELRAPEAHALIESGVIFGGMIPKVRVALEAVARGARAAVITDVDGLRSRRGTQIRS